MWWHSHRNQISSFGEKNESILIGGGRQFSRLPVAEVCATAVVMLDSPCSEVVWRLLVTHSIHQFPLHFPSRASPCAITFQLESTFIAICRWILFRMKKLSVRVAEQIKTRILCSTTFFRNSCRLWDSVENYGRAGQATDDNMAHAHCMLDN